VFFHDAKQSHIKVGGTELHESLYVSERLAGIEQRRGRDHGLAELVPPTFCETKPCARSASSTFQISGSKLGPIRPDPTFEMSFPRRSHTMPPLQGLDMYWWMPYPGRRCAVPWAIILSSFQDLRSGAEKLPNEANSRNPRAARKTRNAGNAWEFRSLRQMYQTNPPSLNRRFQDLRSQIVPEEVVFEIHLGNPRNLRLNENYETNPCGRHGEKKGGKGAQRAILRKEPIFPIRVLRVHSWLHQKITKRSHRMNKRKQRAMNHSRSISTPYQCLICSIRGYGNLRNEAIG
jgi:hypothetical protein